jgi:hypothetical protein
MTDALNIISEELIASIQKNLPAAAADVIQTRLAQAKTLENRVEYLTKQLADQSERLNSATKSSSRMEMDLAKHQALDVREADISMRERDLEITVLKIQLEGSKGNAEFARNVALGLVRNTEFRTTNYSSVSNSSQQPNGCWITENATTNGNHSSTAT